MYQRWSFIHKVYVASPSYYTVYSRLLDIPILFSYKNCSHWKSLKKKYCTPQDSGWWYWKFNIHWGIRIDVLMKRIKCSMMCISLKNTKKKWSIHSNWICSNVCASIELNRINLFVQSHSDRSRENQVDEIQVCRSAICILNIDKYWRQKHSLEFNCELLNLKYYLHKVNKIKFIFLTSLIAVKPKILIFEFNGWIRCHSSKS